MLTRFIRLDADLTAFFQRQLEYVKSKTYDKKYPELKARMLIPVSFDGGPAASSIVYQQYDQVGMAKLIASYADDLPRSDVTAREFVTKIKSMANSFGFNIQEIREAKALGVPLQQRKANSAKRAMLMLENKIAFFGDADAGLLGLFNHPNISRTAVPLNAGSTSTLWANKTPDEILKDMNAAGDFVIESTNGVELADTLVLPLKQYNYVKSTARSSNSDKTILQYFNENNGYIKQVEWLNELKGAGTGGTLDAMIAYRKDPDVMELSIPQDFEQLPEEERGLEYITPCHQRIGGVLVYYPMAINFCEGI